MKSGKTVEDIIHKIIDNVREEREGNENSANSKQA